MTGVDPALASLDVARAKPNATRVRWIHSDARTLPPMRVDLATMTGNVAQVIADPTDWSATLSGVHGALRPGGQLVFETRDPAFRGWREWNRAASHRFASDGQVLTSDSTLRFREREEVHRPGRELVFFASRPG